jgi:hypothetical protein
MKIRVLHHDHCFDGFASAAVFWRFYVAKVDPKADVGFTGLSHAPNQKFIEETLLDGDQNAIVDFKYSPSSRLTWWFDHHQSAFLSPADERHFFAEKSPTKYYDPDYRSCTKLIADTAASRYGFHRKDLAELIEWADIIDGAQYSSAQVAVELKEPALRLMLVIEASRTPGLTDRIIRGMGTKTLAEIAADPEVDREFQPLYERHRSTIALIKSLAVNERGVVFFDLSEHDAVGYSKFIPYYLFPDCVYSVGVSLTPNRSKVSVGFNPWSQSPRRHNLASICERHNGGGHAVVGAISLAPDDLDQARMVAKEIAAELRS